METEEGAKVEPKPEPEVEGTDQGREQRSRDTTSVQGAPSVRQNQPSVNIGAPAVKDETPSEHQGTSGGARGETLHEPSVPSVGINAPSVREGVPYRPKPRLSNLSDRGRHKTKVKHPKDISKIRAITRPKERLCTIREFDI